MKKKPEKSFTDGFFFVYNVYTVFHTNAVFFACYMAGEAGIILGGKHEYGKMGLLI